MFKNILVPTDGSMAALHATTSVAALASAVKDAHVTIVTVLSPYDPGETDFVDDLANLLNARMRRQAERALEATVKVFENHQVNHTMKILEGDPVSAVIAQEAEKGHYDLIA